MELKQLESIATALEELTASVNRLRRDAVSKGDLAHLVQQTTWDLNMLRQSAASKENLRRLGGQLVTRRDLHLALETVCRRLAGLRFENHQEHQELHRTLDEGPYGLALARGREGVSPLPAPTAMATTAPVKAALSFGGVSIEIPRKPIGKKAVPKVAWTKSMDTRSGKAWDTATPMVEMPVTRRRR